MEKISRLSHVLRKNKNKKDTKCNSSSLAIHSFRWMASGIQHGQGMEQSVSPSTGGYKYYTSALKILVLTYLPPPASKIVRLKP